MSLAWGRMQSSMMRGAGYAARRSAPSARGAFCDSARASFRSPHMKTIHSHQARHFSMNSALNHARGYMSSSSESAQSSNGRRLGAAAVGLVGGSLVAYLIGKHVIEDEAEEDVAYRQLVPPETFVHPYDDASWAWKMFFRTKRFLYLFVVFLPVCTVAAIAKVTASEQWRAYLLEVLVDACNSAGCGIQKFGQWLSMRPDMFPADLIAALSTMQQDIPAHDIEHTRAIIMESFGVQLEDMFEEFSEKPIASGTVAQVHKGRLREEYTQRANIRDANGVLQRDVAIKVRHPNVLDEVWVDIELLYKFCQWTELFFIPFTKDDFLNTLQKQVDFTWEAYNLARFAENFKDECQDGDLQFPYVSLDLCSSSVLLESWCGGTTVTDIFSDVGEGFSVVGEGFQKVGHAIEEVADDIAGSISEELLQKKKTLASTIFDMSIKMFLRDNLCHGDLHGGNVMFDVEGNCCTVLDAGMTTSLASEVQADFGQFLHALCTADSDKLVDKILSFHVEVSAENRAYQGKLASNFSSEDPEERRIAREHFRQDVQAAMDKWIDPKGKATNPNGGPISLGDIIGEVMMSLQKHGVSLRGDVASSLMTMSITEGLIRSLDPEYDLVRHALPYFVRYNGWTSPTKLGVQH